MFNKKLTVALVVLLSVFAVQAQARIVTDEYDADDFDMEFWVDGSTLLSYSSSMSNMVVVSDSWELDVPASGAGELTFEIQDITISYGGQDYTGTLTELKVDFDEDTNYEIVASVSGYIVTLEIPASVLTAAQQLYPAKVENNVPISMPDDVEYFLDFSGLPE